MSDPSPVPVPKDASSFASLPASLTGSAKKSNEMWDDSALADDVATISYEQALRSHRRVPAAESLPEFETPVAEAHTVANPVHVDASKKRKTASITIRLTEAEEVQLRERAGAAQLSVSAYLRSCIFEAESLRAQVKEAVSQMKTITASDSHGLLEPQPKPTHDWRARFLPRWSRPRVSL